MYYRKRTLRQSIELYHNWPWSVCKCAPIHFSAERDHEKPSVFVCVSKDVSVVFAYFSVPLSSLEVWRWDSVTGSRIITRTLQTPQTNILQPRTNTGGTFVNRISRLSVRQAARELEINQHSGQRTRWTALAVNWSVAAVTISLFHRRVTVSVHQGEH